MQSKLDGSNIYVNYYEGPPKFGAVNFGITRARYNRVFISIPAQAQYSAFTYKFKVNLYSEGYKIG